MPYVERDSGTNVIKGVYANLQAGYAEEFLADTDPAVMAFRNPPPTTEQSRAAALKANVRRQALITFIQGNDDVGVIAAISARYPSLTGDALKAVVDLYLVLSPAIRS